MEEAIRAHILQIFPIFSGSQHAGLFLWKAVVIALGGYLNWVNPKRYIWSVVCMLGIIPATLLVTLENNPDPLSLSVRFYLIWMCLEVSFQSAAAVPEQRLRGWWTLLVAALLLL